MDYPYYYSANEYYRKFFGRKAYRLSLNGGMTCPNRDGTVGRGGCIFCSEGGSGDFAEPAIMPVHEQISAAISHVPERYRCSSFIAYFQAFSNTYAPVSYLDKIFSEAAKFPRISGIIIATRPDCLPDDVIALIKDLSHKKPLWIELGLQTINDTTAALINRGYKLEVFEEALSKLNAIDVPVTVHTIIGLPGENSGDYMSCAEYLAGKNIHGIKLQLLHVLKGTGLETLYANGSFNVLTLDEYVQNIVNILEILPPDMVIYRLTGDGPKNMLIAPK